MMKQATITAKGRKLRDDVNQALLPMAQQSPDYPQIGYDRLGDCSLLARRAARYAKRQEQACTYEWACGDKWDADEGRLERSITELAITLPGVVGVTFSGDPRGYCVRLILANGACNTWGGEEGGFGIA